MEGIFLYNQPESIMEKYDLEVTQITKGRGVYLCSTQEGMKVLLPFAGSQERAAFLASYLQYLQEAGFAVEQILPTSEGAAAAEDESGMRYILKTCIQGSECSTRKWDEMKRGAALLAEYHRVAGGYKGEIPDYLCRTESIQELWRKRIRELVLLKNYAKTRRHRNDFERNYAEQFPFFAEKAKEALKLLEEDGEAEERILCHGAYNQHNVLRTKEGYRVVHFEHFTYDDPMTDLAGYVRKMMEKNNWKEGLGDGLIEAYGESLPLTYRQRRRLGIMLRFPEKFWKIANHYVNSRKAWASGRDLEKLERVIAQEEARQEFLRNFVVL